MKSMLDETTRREIQGRIEALSASSQPQWGAMNVFQMLKHCRQWEEMVLHNKKYKRPLIGRLFGKRALRSVLKDDTPLGRHSPTIPDLRIAEKDGDINAEKQKWIELISQYGQYRHPEFIHPFFGRMNPDQIGRFAYKHTDHHLRQFNV